MAINQGDITVDAFAIADNESPTFDFSAANYSVTEGNTSDFTTSVTVRVTRTGSITGTDTVQLQLSDGTAKGSAAAPTQNTSQGANSSATPYLMPATSGSGVNVTSILTVGDSVNNKPDGTPYRMVGIPDGLGAFDNGDGTFTLLMNQEISSTSGVTRAHGGKGAFVSSWVINKSNLSVVSGSDLIQNVYNWNATTQSSNTTTSTINFNRFCSADLAASTAYYNAATGLGSQARIFMSGEEGGATGYQLATVATGANKGNTYILGKFNLTTNGSGLTGVGGWENALANPLAQDKTIVIGNNDGGTGIMSQSVAVYVGTKTNTGTEIDKAGLTNGTLKFINVTGSPAEIVNTTTRATNITSGTAFTLSGTASTTFSRPEDGAWNPLNHSQYFFVTTDRIDQVSDGIGTQVGRSRLWRLNFADITNPDAGGTIDQLLDGTEGGNMFDNMTVDKYGHILLQEDVGGAAHNGKIWQYDIATDSLKLLAKHDPARFGDIGVAATAPFNNDEESSGIIDAEDILGPGWFLLDTQAHYGISGELVEGGQLQALFNPDTYKAYQADYNNSPITVTFAPGETFKDVQIPVAGDTSVENNETVNLTLGNASAGSLVGTKQPNAVLTIQSDDPPTNITLSATTTNENVTANSVVGTFSSIDSTIGNTVTYSLVPGTNDNAAFTISQNQLLINASPNFEAKSSYSIVVRSTDQSGLYTDKTFTITINDVNDPASISGNGAVSIKEGTNVNANGKLITSGSLTVTDEDAGQNKFATTVVSANGNLGSLTITDTGAFSYSVDNSAVQYLGAGQTKVDSFTITSLDGTASKQIDITINGVTADFTGVAAGDATSNSVILWTRTFDTATPSQSSGVTENVKLEISSDLGFGNIVQSINSVTRDANYDYTLKINATGLQSNTKYYYRFQAATGELSQVGTFKTTPNPTVAASVKFAFSGDMDGLMRPYPLASAVPAENLDFYVNLGDVIYENASNVAGNNGASWLNSPSVTLSNDSLSFNGIPRAFIPSGTPFATQAQLKADYEKKYRENFLPVNNGGQNSLQVFYAGQGNYTTWDNHELGNRKYIDGGAPAGGSVGGATGTNMLTGRGVDARAGGSGNVNNVNDAADLLSPTALAALGGFMNQSTGFQTLRDVFLNYQPIAERTVIAPSDPRSDGTKQLYSAVQWGKNALYINTDSRTYRDIRLKTANGGTDDTGSRADNPDRTYLGDTQLAWLKQTLLDAQTAGTPWKFISVSDPIDQLGPIGGALSGTLTSVNSDGGKSYIGGYRAERNDLLKFIADNGIKNVVFLSTDDHQNRINELYYSPTGQTGVQSSYVKVPYVFSIVDGPLGATGPDAITNHAFSNVKAIADDLATKQAAAGIEPIGLNGYAGLHDVKRDQDGTLVSKATPEAVDFYSPDTFNYSVLEVSPDGNTLTVTSKGINSTAQNSAKEYDASNNPVRTLFSFQVDAGVAPTDLALSATSVNENVAANTVIGTFTTTDANSTDFTYSLVSGIGGADNSAFTISGNQLKINASPDFETKSTYNILVRTTDNTGLSFDKPLTVNVNNLNELTTVDLSNYIRVGRYDLPEPTRTTPPDAFSLLAQEVSAVTYNWDSDTLFVVGDGGRSVVQVSKTGQLINSMTLAPGNSPQGTDFYDTEGLTYVGNGKFVLIEERDRQANLFTYVPGTTLTKANAQTVKLGTTIDNIGIEGISWDPQTGGFIAVKEKQPEGIFQTTIDFAAGTASNGSPTTENSTNLFNPALANLLDFADVYALSNLSSLSGQPDFSHLLVLSQESGKIVNIDRSGNISSSLTIASDPGNPASVPDQQHEGLTMDKDGYLYVVSENGGGDINHPQLWVYAPSTVPNQAPTAVVLNNQVTAIAENTSTTAAIKVADITITDDGLGTNTLSLSGTDASFFEISASGLYIKAGTNLDYETKTSYSVTVNVDDATLGNNPDATTNFTLAVTDVANEVPPTLPSLIISEVSPWSSGNSVYAADWFEVTNTGTSAVDITGWKMDDNSNSFGSSVALNGVTSIAPGQSVVFIEGNGSNISAFKTAWFGNSIPSDFTIGSYTGSGVGLSTGGDAVNLFNAGGTRITGVNFGPSTTYFTFDNTTGLGSTTLPLPTVSTLSAVGVNGAFLSVNNALNVTVKETGSPGRIASVNQAPTGNASATLATGTEDTTYTINSSALLQGFSDVDGDTLSVSNLTANNGILSDNGNGTYSFSPNANYNGTVNLSYNVIDGNGGSVAATQSFNLAAVNDAPILTVTTAQTANSNVSQIIPGISLTDVDAGSNQLQVTLSLANGSATLSSISNLSFIAGDGNQDTFMTFKGSLTAINTALNNLSYRSNPGFFGNDSLSITVNDLGNTGSGGALTDSKAIAVTVYNQIIGTSANQTFTATINPDRILAGGGNDQVNATFANVQQNDIIDGEVGTDLFTLAGAPTTTALTLDLTNSANQLAGISGLTIRNFERFNFSNSASSLNFTGSAIADEVVGSSGINFMLGGDGNDSLTGGAKNDILNGESGNDTLTGGGGDDTLTGGTGTNTLKGGTGNDTYIVSSSTDIITEAASAGTDSVFASVNFTLASNVENLILTGTDAINGTGNTLNNTIIGNSANNTLNGGSGNDTLIGGTGTNTLIGGTGNDTYIVSSSTDIITEAASSGTDSVFASVNFTLANNVENLTLTGTDAINGFGNDLNNTIVGNNANNYLFGGAGNDVLTGNAGADTFDGGIGNDTFNLGLDSDVDTIIYTIGQGVDTANQFTRGAGGDLLKFVNNIAVDVIVNGSNTSFRLSDSISGNSGFGTGILLLTLNGTTGFSQANLGLNLAADNAANFLFS